MNSVDGYQCNCHEGFQGRNCQGMPSLSEKQKQNKKQKQKNKKEAKQNKTTTTITRQKPETTDCMTISMNQTIGSEQSYYYIRLQRLDSSI